MQFRSWVFFLSPICYIVLGLAFWLLSFLSARVLYWALFFIFKALPARDGTDQEPLTAALSYSSCTYYSMGWGGQA